MVTKNRILISAGILAATVIAGTCLLGASSSFLSEAEKPSPLRSSINSTVVHELQNTYQKIYDEYKDSVVFISTEKTLKIQRNNPFANDPFFRQFFGDGGGESTRKAHGLGTGFIISSDGYICTNHHVVADIDSVTVKVNDSEYNAKVIGSDKLIDIALLKIDGSKKFKPVHFGDSDKLKVGDIVVAIGNPYGLDRTFTSGIISATGRTAIDATGNSHIQTDASINQGNSGGPLINIDGEVIGVNRAILSETGGNVGIGFSIPVNTVKTTLAQLKEHGKIKRGYIGVSIAPLTQEFAKELGLDNTNGALVGGVEEGSPADKGGVRIRDVITAVNDSAVNEYRDLLTAVSNAQIGKTVKLTVWRDKRKTNLWVTVKERP